MGNFLSKQWDIQGYYNDMTEGFITRVDGTPRMIIFPKVLQTYPQYCTKCHRKSGLQLDQMYSCMQAERVRFRQHVKAIIEKRIGDGDPPVKPDELSRDSAVKDQSTWSLFRQRVMRWAPKRNGVGPEEEAEPCHEEEHHPFGFRVDISEIIVCHDCLIGGDNEIAEDDDGSGNHVLESCPKDQIEGQQTDLVDTAPGPLAAKKSTEVKSTFEDSNAMEFELSQDTN